MAGQAVLIQLQQAMARRRPQVDPGDGFSLFDVLNPQATVCGVVNSWLTRESNNSVLQHVPGAIYLPDQQFCRDLGIGTASAGGNLAGSSIQAVADASRPPLLLETLGARRLEVRSDAVVSLPVWVAGAAAGWLAEGSSAPGNTSTLRQVALTGKLAAARLAVSRKCQLSIADLQPAVLGELANAVRATIEAGFITGTGSNNTPLGLINTTGRSTVSFAAAAPTFAELRSMLSSYLSADGDLTGAAWLLNPSDFVALQGTQVAPSLGSDQVLEYHGGNWRALGIPAYATRHLTAGNIMLFNPAEVVCCYWGAPQIIADDRTNGKSIQGAVEFILLNLCDVGALHPARIVVGSS